MKNIIVHFIEIYQKRISPIFGEIGDHCKYYPSCSEYMKQAILKYGTFKGVILGIKRLLRCNPFSKGGYDPLN